MIDPLSGLDEVGWPYLRAASGSAANVPSLLRRLVAVDGDANLRNLALDDLYGTVRHQGDLHECTPYVVPFALRLIATGGLSDETCASLGLMLVAVDGELRFGTLAEQCHAALIRHLDLLESGFAVTSRGTRAALVAVAASIAAAVPDSLRTTIADVPEMGEACLESAVAVTLALIAQIPLSADQLEGHAAQDEEAAASLADNAHWPIEQRAVDVVELLCERAVSQRLSRHGL